MNAAGAAAAKKERKKNRCKRFQWLLRDVAVDFKFAVAQKKTTTMRRAKEKM